MGLKRELLRNEPGCSVMHGQALSFRRNNALIYGQAAVLEMATRG